MCDLNPEYGQATPAETLGKICISAFTFLVIVPALKTWEVLGRADRYIRLGYARKLGKLACHLDCWAYSLKSKADRITRTTG